MAVAEQYLEKTDEQKAMTEMVRKFADEQIIPNAEHYDHEDEFPEPIVEQMRELGLFGVTIPEEYGGLGLDLTTYAMIVEELSRGWISISGIVNTDKDAHPPYKGMTCFVAEKEPGVSKNTGEYAGFTVPPKIKKMGYKGVESTELVFDGYRCPADNILGGEEAGLGQGFTQMMDALEVGRVNVAARGVGIAQRALELALRYSQERKTFGKEIAQHQAIQFKLADMATKVDAARLLTLRAARLKDAGERSDLEAGLDRRFPSRTGKEVVEDAFRIHGGYGYSKEYENQR